MCASSRRAESSRSQNVTKAIDNGRDGARFRKVSVYRSTLWDPRHKDSSQVRCPTFNPLLESPLFVPFTTPARSSRSVSQGGWDERKRGTGEGSGTTPAINTVMTLASLPPSRCYYAKRFAVLCHREYAGILEPSLNPIHRASAFIEPSPLRLSLFSLFFRSVEANGPSPRSSRSYYYCI